MAGRVKGELGELTHGSGVAVVGFVNVSSSELRLKRRYTTTTITRRTAAPNVDKTTTRFWSTLELGADVEAPGDFVLVGLGTGVGDVGLALLVIVTVEGGKVEGVTVVGGSGVEVGGITVGGVVVGITGVLVTGGVVTGVLVTGGVVTGVDVTGGLVTGGVVTGVVVTGGVVTGVLVETTVLEDWAAIMGAAGLFVVTANGIGDLFT